jgi:hypothetical protein
VAEREHVAHARDEVSEGFALVADGQRDDGAAGFLEFGFAGELVLEALCHQQAGEGAEWSVWFLSAAVVDLVLQREEVRAVEPRGDL